MPALSDQRVVITGAGQGLGAAIARHFAAEGAMLVLMDIDAEGLVVTNNQIGGNAECITVDLADAAATQTALDRIGGQIDTVIHNAAILKPEPMDDLTLDMFQATVNVCIQAGYQLAKAAWPYMKANGGTLIFVSSQSGIKGFADESAYCAAKHALEGFSKCLAMEGEAHGILSCTVTPGMAMHTPMSERNYPPELKKTWVAPDKLAPAFAHIATMRDAALNGKRLNAWDLSQEQTA